MKNHTMYSSLLGLLLVAFAAPYMGAEENSCSSMMECGEQGKAVSAKQYVDDCEILNQLELGKLCAKRVKAHCIDSKKITSRKICADSLVAKRACIKELNDFEHICASSLDAIDASIMNIKTNNVCVSDVLQANTITQCKPYRATVVFGTNTTYTLGQPLNFDVILDDPQGDISLVPFTHYTVPVSGYYIVTLQLDISSLSPTSPNTTILGSPIARPAIMVNGVVFRELNIPFLTFVPQQEATLTALVSANAGDVISSSYNVYTVDPVLGLQVVTGTAGIPGDGTEVHKSTLKIHYLSSFCNPGPCPVITNCNPVAHCDFDCDPCC